MDDELRQQFHFFDANSSGFIEKEELRAALGKLGYDISEEGFENLLTVVGSKDDRLDFEEFVAWNRELYKEEMKVEFHAMDKDGSGWISKAELKERAINMKYNWTEEQIDDFLYEADANQNDKVGLDEFTTAMAAMMSGKAYFDISVVMYLEKLRADFKEIDYNGDGTITRTDLLQKAKEVSYRLSEEELEGIVESMDADGDGKISLEEFIGSIVKHHGS